MVTLEQRAYDFSVRVTECVRYLKSDRKSFPLCDKLLDCGIAAGLAVRTGKHKAAAEMVTQVDYILEMAARSGYLTEVQTREIRADAKKPLDELR